MTLGSEILHGIALMGGLVGAIFLLSKLPARLIPSNDNLIYTVLFYFIFLCVGAGIAFLIDELFSIKL